MVKYHAMGAQVVTCGVDLGNKVNNTYFLVYLMFSCFNPRPTKPCFVTWFTKGVVTTPS